MAQHYNAMDTGKPRIGVTLPDNGAWLSWNCIRLAITLAGGKAVRVSPKNPYFDDQFDGLVLAGGTDIYPPRYQGSAKHSYRYDHKRDEMELRWLRHAEENGVPVLGICRGAQLINVHRGGDLHLDVSKVYEKANYPNGTIARVFYRKRVQIQADTLLCEIIGEEFSRVNSLHTQAINSLGTNLKVSALEANRVVQAVEDKTARFIVGVQFHPEYLIYARRYRAIFKWLVNDARQD